MEFAELLKIGAEHGFSATELVLCIILWSQSKRIDSLIQLVKELALKKNA